MTSTATTWRARSPGIFRHSQRDAVLVGLAMVHGILLVTVPSIPLVAIGLWWNANTIAHQFIHRPFFGAKWANHAFSGALTLLLGVPQRLWRERHLAHHANRPVRLVLTRGVALELMLLSVIWVPFALIAPAIFFLIYLPGWAVGLGLCALQGHYEHAGGTTSHYGRLYNLLFFNDGYHVEHHERPGLHWSALGGRQVPEARASRWPPVLRWLDACSLCGLERLVVRSPWLQRFVIDRHETAMRRLIGDERPAHVIAIGGGLFPRTALIMARLFPRARVTLVDASASHLEIARRFVGPEVALVHRRWDPMTPFSDAPPDLVVVPLAYVGDKQAFFDSPPAPVVVVHDWIWTRRGTRSAVVSVWLLKRLNRV